MILKALAFDFGHTLMDEQKDRMTAIESRPVHLMPYVLEVLPALALPLAIWANTRTAREAELRRWLDRAGIEQFFSWVVTSVDAGCRKPAREFFDFALGKCAVNKEEILLVGNQLNTDVKGGEAYGIRTVWLSGPAYRSADETLSPNDVRPSYTISTLRELPALINRSAIPKCAPELSGSRSLRQRPGMHALTKHKA